MKHTVGSALWLRSLLLGSACYAVSNGLVHISDWCYLAASAAVAAVVSAGLLPLHRWLMLRQPRRLRELPLLWALGCTLVVFGVGVLLTWPLHSWPGPDGLWPWGAGALLATTVSPWRANPLSAIPEIGTVPEQADKPVATAAFSA